MSGLVAAVALGLAVAVLVGGRSTPSLLRLRVALRSGDTTTDRAVASASLPHGGTAPATLHRSTRSARAGAHPTLRARRAVGAAVVVVAVGAGASFGPPVAVLVVATVPTVMWLRRRRQHEAIRRRRSAAVADACLVIGSELAAGGSAQQAMDAAAREWPDMFAAAAGQMSTGGDPVPALRAAARLPGAEAMSAVAAAWEVAEDTGARAALVLRVVADSVRDEAAVRQEAEAQLTTVRTTARMLAALPPITLVLFSGGLEPVRFLIGNPYGIACLAGAAALLALGLTWVDMVRREATRSAWRL